MAKPGWCSVRVLFTGESFKPGKCAVKISIGIPSPGTGFTQHIGTELGNVRAALQRYVISRQLEIMVTDVI